MKLALFATGQFGAEILKGLIETEYKPDFLITNPDRPAGRGNKLKAPPTKELLEKLSPAIPPPPSGRGRIKEGEGISILQPEKLDNAFAGKVKEKKIDLALACDFGRIIPQNILDIPNKGFLGLHPSLLPRYRGPTPIKTAILNGETESGVSLYLTDEKVDHGPILAQRKVGISNLYYPEARDKLAQAGVDLFKFILPEWLEGEIEAEKQDHAQATKTRLFKKKDGRIDWSENEVKIYNKVRALYPWPGTFTFFKHKGKRIRLKILKAELTNSQPKEKEGALKPGTISKTHNQLSVKTGFGLIQLTQVQPAGKKPISGADFLNGYQDVEQFD